VSAFFGDRAFHKENENDERESKENHFVQTSSRSPASIPNTTTGPVKIAARLINV
jgi:hypothetical protein